MAGLTEDNFDRVLKNNWIKERDEILKEQAIVEHVRKEFNFYDIAFKKHKDIDDFKIAQVLSKILKANE